MFDTRNRLSAKVAQDVKTHFQDLVFKTVIPKNVRISEAPSFGKPVLMYDVRCTGTIAYAELAKELGTVLANECQEKTLILDLDFSSNHLLKLMGYKKSSKEFTQIKEGKKQFVQINKKLDIAF